jgi:1-acyl-sn-glycerol-3-phosphate acyltransferase
MIRILLALITISLMTLICGIPTIISGIFNPYSRLIYYLGQIWSRSILWIAGTRILVEGLDHIDTRRQYVFIGNHQSHFDVLVVFSRIPMIIRFLTKKELFRIPVFGWALSATGMIKIDRADHEESVKSMNEALEVMRKNKVSLVVFPEGTRSPDGKMGPFKKGGFIMAIRGKIPVVPVAISGSRFILPKHSIKLKPGTIKLVIGQPIATTDLTYSDRAHLMAETIAVIQDHIESRYNERE